MKCKNCKHWKLDECDSYNDLVSPYDPVTYKMIDPTKDGGEDEIAKKWGHNVRRCRSPKVTFYERPTKDGATVCDGSKYMAELLTGEDFGCIHFEHTEPSDGKWETTDDKANAIRVHRFGLESVTSFDGLKATCLIVGKWKLTWAKL